MRKNKCYIIAEAGVNHNGNLELAKSLIVEAKQAGADAIKFQCFNADTLVTSKAPKASYQLANTEADESQYQMLKKLELSESDHQQLMKYADKQGIDFLSSAFCTNGLTSLLKLGLKTIKIPSGEITHLPLLIEAGRAGCKIILSTGASTIGEVEFALACLAYGFLNPASMPKNYSQIMEAYLLPAAETYLKQHVSLLHCCSQYPAPFDAIHLNALKTLRKAFNLPVGYSDHTKGIHISLAAIALGAKIIEKHFTLDKELPGPDHKASLEPSAFKELVCAARQIEIAIGNGVKKPAPAEMANRQIIRKGVVARQFIPANTLLELDNIICKRPSAQHHPFEFFNLLGTRSIKDYEQDEIMSRFIQED